MEQDIPRRKSNSLAEKELAEKLQVPIIGRKKSNGGHFGTWSGGSSGRPRKNSAVQLLLSLKELLGSSSSKSESTSAATSENEMIPTTDSGPSESEESEDEKVVRRPSSSMPIFELSTPSEEESSSPPQAQIPRSMSHQNLAGKTVGPSYFFATVTRARNGIFDFWKKMEKVVERDRRPMVIGSPLSKPEMNSPNARPLLSSQSMHNVHSAPVTPVRSTSGVRKVPQAPLISKDWKQQTEENWEKPLNKTSVVKDLPRLVTFILVELSEDQSDFASRQLNPPQNPIDDDEPPAVLLRARSLDEENFLKIEAQKRTQVAVPHENVSEKILNLLLQLSALVENNNEYPAFVYQTYVNNVKAENDETGALARQLHKVLHEIGEDSKVINILKACTQGIIAPIIIELRLRILPNIPFKDSTGWNVRIFVKDEKLVVNHFKHQCNQNLNKPEEEFEFEWVLSMKFDLQMSKMEEVNFSIASLKFGDQIEPTLKDKIVTCFEKYLTPSSS